MENIPAASDWRHGSSTGLCPPTDLPEMHNSRRCHWSISGERLEINAATRVKGSVKVEMIDAVSRPLSTIAISLPFQETICGTRCFHGLPVRTSLRGKASR